MRNDRVLRIALCLWAVSGTLSAVADESTATRSGWAVATAHPAATEAAYRIAGEGGNAFDAAVAATADAASGKLVVYTSQPSKDAQQTVDAFHEVHPGVEEGLAGIELQRVAAQDDVVLELRGNLLESRFISQRSEGLVTEGPSPVTCPAAVNSLLQGNQGSLFLPT